MVIIKYRVVSSGWFYLYWSYTICVTGSWNEASLYASWTGVSSGTGLVLYGLIGSETVIVGLICVFVFHSLTDWCSDAVV